MEDAGQTRVDPRVIKTRRSIEEAFVRLLLEKDFERITVQNILDEALVNRKTFYKYYEDKYNLANVLIEAVNERFEAALRTRLFSVVKRSDMPDALRSLYEVLFDDRDRIVALMGVHTSQHNLPDDFRRILKKNYLDRFDSEFDGASQLEIDFLSESYAALSFASIRWALESGNRERIDVICELSIPRSGWVGSAFLELPTGGR